MLSIQLGEEASARKAGVDALQKWFDQNQVEQKLAEEMIRTELDALSSTVASHKLLLEDQITHEVRV
jgi:hypothetical protein